jgi:hypothetical protein
MFEGGEMLIRCLPTHWRQFNGWIGTRKERHDSFPMEFNEHVGESDRRHAGQKSVGQFNELGVKTAALIRTIVRAAALRAEIASTSINGGATF